MRVSAFLRDVARACIHYPYSMQPSRMCESRPRKVLLQADVYSFGMLMWEMVTSTMPWERMTVGQVFFAVVQEDARPPIPEELPEAYSDLMTVWTYFFDNNAGHV